MKNLSLFAVCLLGLALFESNPKAKDRYVEQVSRDFQSRCCRMAAASANDGCTRLRPITQSVVKVVLHFYTDAPEDHIFFTRYVTHLPNQTIYGVGVAGQVVSWADSASNKEPCDMIYNTLLHHPL